MAIAAVPGLWSILGSLGSAAGGAGGLLGALSGLFGGNKKGGEMVNLEKLMPSWMTGSAKNLYSWAQKYMDQYVPGEAYSGKFTAGMTPFENMGLGLLGNYLKAPMTGETYLAGKRQLMDTLGGKYSNLYQSPVIQAIRNQGQIGYDDLINQARRGQGARGSYFQSTALGEERELGRRHLADVNSLIADFIGQERGRQFSAIPMAQAYDEYESGAPLKKIAASQSYGALQRLIDQSDFEARYNDYTRQRSEMGQPISVMQGLAGGQGYPTSLQAPYQEGSSSIANILKILGSFNYGAMGQEGTIWDKLGGLLGGNA